MENKQLETERKVARMKGIVIAVMLSFVGPGLGQIYNKDYRKGAVLLALSTILFFVPMIWLVLKLAPMLPGPEQPPVSQEQVKTVALQVIQSDRHLLNLVSFAFLGLWAYAITQAYFKAREIHEKSAAEENQNQDDSTGP